MQFQFGFARLHLLEAFILDVSTGIIPITNDYSISILSAGFEIGDEGNRSLTWNRNNNSSAQMLLL